MTLEILTLRDKFDILLAKRFSSVLSGTKTRNRLYLDNHIDRSSELNAGVLVAERINMKSQFSLLLILLTLSTSLFADSFDIGGKEITIPTPDGYVRVTKEMDAVHRLSMQMSDPWNELLAYYINESDAATAREGNLPPIERRFMLKVSKELKGMLVGSRDFAELKSMTKRQNKEIWESLKSQMPGLLDKASKGIGKEFDMSLAFEISEMVPLDPHYEADNALSYSWYANYGVSAEGVKEEFVVAATTTFVNASGKVLFLYCYAPQGDLEWTRDASRAWAERVMGGNAQPPTQSSGGRGINWRKVMEKSVGGAIAGGLIALVLGALSIFKRKKTG